MPTVVLDAVSKAYPTISNRIRASITLSNDVAIIASIIDVTAGHPSRVWHFPGLARANYAFSLDEIDGGGVPIQNLAYFDVVPSNIDGLLSRDDEQIIVDLTSGFTAGLNTVTFDGTAGKPNYIGWTIVPSELTGRGILALGLDYSWVPSTGVFTLLQAGDILQTGTYYNIHFDPNVQTAGGSPPSVIDFTARLITADDTALITDFGNTIILEPAGVYLILSLPDIATVPVGRILTVEMIKLRGNAVQCTKFLPNGADVINFMRGNLYMMNNENLAIYRFMRPDLSNEWRVRNEHGNFHRIGEPTGDDAIATGVYCKQLYDGSAKNKYQFARIFNEVVLTLPGTQVCNYDDWATGNNKYLFSLANSADPGNVDKFHFPDRRGIFERNNNAGKSGDFATDSIKNHVHSVSPPSSNSQAGFGLTTTGSDPLGGDGPVTAYNTANNTGGTSETAPKHYLINKYVLI